MPMIRLDGADVTDRVFVAWTFGVHLFPLNWGWARYEVWHPPPMGCWARVVRVCYRHVKASRHGAVICEPVVSGGVLAAACHTDIAF